MNFYQFSTVIRLTRPPQEKGKPKMTIFRKEAAWFDLKENARMVAHLDFVGNIPAY